MMVHDAVNEAGWLISTVLGKHRDELNERDTTSCEKLHEAVELLAEVADGLPTCDQCTLTVECPECAESRIAELAGDATRDERFA